MSIEQFIIPGAVAEAAYLNNENHLLGQSTEFDLDGYESLESAQVGYSGPSIENTLATIALFDGQNTVTTPGSIVTAQEPDLLTSVRTTEPRQSLSLVEEAVSSEPQVADGAPSIQEIFAPERISLDGGYECFATDDPELISEARRMTARFYLKRNFITSDQLDAEGRIAEEHDPYLSNARYYVLRDRESGGLVASCRVIHYDEEKGEASFPVFEPKHQDRLYKKRLEELRVAGVENIVEISALVKNPELDKSGDAVFRLYRKLFQDAWSNGGGDQTFVMACNPKLYRRLKLAFNGSIVRLGRDLDYPGQVAVPATFSSGAGTLRYIEKSGSKLNIRATAYRRILRFMLGGMDPETLNPDILQALHDNGHTDLVEQLHQRAVDGEGPTPFNREEARGRTSRRPEILAAAGLLGYTALRTILVKDAVAPNTHVDWRAFLALEAGTTWHYTKSMGTLVRAAINPEAFDKARKVKAAAVAASTFATPYVYLGIEGQDMSGGAAIGTAAVVGVSAMAAVSKVRRARRSRESQPELRSEADPVEADEYYQQAS